LSTALDAEALADFAQIVQVEHLRISKATTIDDFQKEIRWNGAFFKLSSLT
jgi:L-arabinose isomerase